eukprot:COSAG06_NODE_55470_length_289_cov_1.015789_1_plen_29_part_10
MGYADDGDDGDGCSGTLITKSIAHSIVTL